MKQYSLCSRTLICFEPKTLNSLAIIFTLEGIEKVKTEQLCKRLQFGWLSFCINKNAQYREKLAKNYKILPFEFPKIEINPTIISSPPNAPQPPTK